VPGGGGARRSLKSSKTRKLKVWRSAVTVNLFSGFLRF
jgi:hypothetical protein